MISNAPHKAATCQVHVLPAVSKVMEAHVVPAVGKPTAAKPVFVPEKLESSSHLYGVIVPESEAVLAPQEAKEPESTAPVGPVSSTEWPKTAEQMVLSVLLDHEARAVDISGALALSAGRLYDVLRKLRIRHRFDIVTFRAAGTGGRAAYRLFTEGSEHDRAIAFIANSHGRGRHPNVDGLREAIRTVVAETIRRRTAYSDKTQRDGWNPDLMEKTHHRDVFNWIENQLEALAPWQWHHSPDGLRAAIRRLQVEIARRRANNNDSAQIDSWNPDKTERMEQRSLLAWIESRLEALADVHNDNDAVIKNDNDAI